MSVSRRRKIVDVLTLGMSWCRWRFSCEDTPLPGTGNLRRCSHTPDRLCSCSSGSYTRRCLKNRRVTYTSPTVPLNFRDELDLWPVQLRPSEARSYLAGQKQWKLPGVFTHWWTQSRPGWLRGNRRHSSISEKQTFQVAEEEDVK